jgi:hypothetical protein
VPEYDAFGRELGEDPLVRLREAMVDPLPAPAPAPAAEAVSAPEAEPPEPAPPQFMRPPRRRHRGLATLLLLLAVIAALVWAGGLVAVTVRDGINGVIHAPATPAPAGLQADSLIRRANFADTLATLRRSGLGRPSRLRVAPERVDATLVGVDGRLHQVEVDFEGNLREVGTSPGPGPAGIAFRRIDRGAPERLARRGAERAGVRARRIDYLVFTAGTWRAYFKGGKIVKGDAHGRPRR